ncbi:Do family serine endopeptidase [Salinarimonas sp.]|uniref:Do family serine endopeptidase n=1 Tax=Salinarimonas sp. TaxID=2766526 RepID=UPI00391B44BF
MIRKSPPRAARAGLLASVAAGALGLAILLPGAAPLAQQTQAPAIEAPVVPTQALTLDQPAQLMPSFADVVDRVKPAVVSVRVRLGEEATGPRAMPGMPGMPGQGGRGMPGFPPGFELPEGSPFEDFFRRFFGEEGQPGQRAEPRQPRRQMPQRASQGSGFFISGDGYVVTNNHVIAGGERIEVVLEDGRVLEAEVIGTDRQTDLALLKVAEEDTQFPYVEFAPGMPRVGDWVVAIGNPFGLGGTVTAGIVSARGRDIGAGPYDDFLQIDAPVNRGNSGGPAFDQLGRVIGVNTAISSPTGGNVGIAFAIPADTATRIVAQLMQDGTVERGFLGVQIQPVTEDIAAGAGLDGARGAIVARVEPDSPAAQAGLEVGDIVLSVEDQPIRDARGLSRAIAFRDPGSDVALTVFRDGSEREVTVTLGRLDADRLAQAEPTPEPEAEPAGFDALGLRLAPVEGDVQGVVVTEVDPDGPAFERGIVEGDVIVEIAGNAITSPQDVAAALEAAEEDGRPAVLVRVERDGSSRFVAFRLPIG